ncbi:MAG TPA: ATP-dependent Clp protease proteolytic subunit [Terracidiphilus sp.]|nr:ATP-dependent Clp protease proteolytic subunit [Terracidiphilus sp.]
MPAMPDDKNSKAPEEIWAIYCGDINAANAAKLLNGLTIVSSAGTKRIHILFQSWGGFVGDGVFLYNALRKIPIEVFLYNAGQVASAATLVFLGAKARKTTANAVFMIHKSTNSTDRAGVDRLKAVTANLTVDDARVEEILRTHLRLPEELWTQFSYHDVYLTGSDAVQYGMADEIAEFSPPPGAKVLNALG